MSPDTIEIPGLMDGVRPRGTPKQEVQNKGKQTWELISWSKFLTPERDAWDTSQGGGGEPEI